MGRLITARSPEPVLLFFVSNGSPFAYTDIQYYLDIARLAEKGRLHAVFLADTLAVSVFFRALGYLLLKLKCEPAPLVLGFILGPLMEEHLRRALLISEGNPSVFFSRPISLFFLLARCLIPGFDGAILSQDWKDALLDKFYMGAPQRQRQSVERYKIVKRA